jgi:alcohol dehydrogenase
MKAVLTLGIGGYDKLSYCDVPRPVPVEDEVILKVLAAGVNNTDINTRIGWYSSIVDEKNVPAVTTAEDDLSDGGWNGTTSFPFIQGTDCCGIVIEVKNREHQPLLGRRVIVRPCIRKNGFCSLENVWMGSDFNGAFAQYLKIRASEVFPVECGWSDVELGAVPCAYGTAENMIHRASLEADETVLVVGASGGVGSAAVQLAKARGARVIALTSGSKIERLKALGVDEVINRDENLIDQLYSTKIDLIIDNVAGEGFSDRFKLLRRGGRLATSGAIAGPVVSLDFRDLYLKDIRLIGSTAWDEPVFPNIVSYIENGKIKPLIAKSFPLEAIADAQKALLSRSHVGKYVLIPSFDD